jgi:small GTP-binding protein
LFSSEEIEAISAPGSDKAWHSRVEKSEEGQGRTDVTDTTLNQTPRGSRLHIAIFGRRNAGKSSLINALTNQDIAIVSDVPGTTTDPVYKSMEILPIGPVVIIDTAGIDDVGELGRLRIEKALGVLGRPDLMIMSSTGFGAGGVRGRCLVRMPARTRSPRIIVVNRRTSTRSSARTRSSPAVAACRGREREDASGIDELRWP